MPTVQLSCAKLLAEIADLLGIDNPQCEIAVAAEGWFIAYIDLHIPRAGPIVDIVRCWGAPSPDLGVATEDAARVSLQKMKSELDLQIKDVNYDNLVVYKNLYDRATVEYAGLLGRFNNLEREYGLLKDCYLTGIAEKANLITERVKMQHTIDEYSAIIAQLHADTDHAVAPDQPCEVASSS